MKKKKIRINKGLSLLAIGIMGIGIFNHLKIPDGIFYFIIGFSLTQMNKYWDYDNITTK